METSTHSDFHLFHAKSKYTGKVRDVYNIDDRYLTIIVSDRISAFDVVLPRSIPLKGQILNKIAAHFLDATSDIVPNWKINTPTASSTIGFKCEPFKVEMVVRGYLAGHAWREYAAGKRTLCGISLPDGLRQNEKLPHPIITPTSKAAEGHDEDISRNDIIASKLVSEKHYTELEKYTLALYQRGCEMAKERGLLLVDTKYEFGLHQGEIYLMDEIHTPDSSRYFYSDTYDACMANGIPPKQLSKEFVREWLMEHGFSGQEGQKIPEMTDHVVEHIQERYKELYEQLLGQRFVPEIISNEEEERRINDVLHRLLNKTHHP